MIAQKCFKGLERFQNVLRINWAFLLEVPALEDAVAQLDESHPEIGDLFRGLIASVRETFCLLIPDH